MSNKGADFFLTKFWTQILADPGCRHVVDWDPSGNYLIIYNTDQLMAEIKARSVCKQKDYDSFARQLRIYRWGRVRENEQGWRPWPDTAKVWKHPRLTRDSDVSDVANITRNAPPKPNRGQGATNISGVRRKATDGLDEIPVSAPIQHDPYATSIPVPSLQALSGTPAPVPLPPAPIPRATASPAPPVSRPHGMGFALQLASMLDEQTAELGLLHTFSLPAEGIESSSGLDTASSRQRRRRDPDDSDEEDLQADDDVILDADQFQFRSNSQAARSVATSHYRASAMIPYASKAHTHSSSAAAVYAHHNVVATFDYLPWLNPEKELLVSAPIRSKSVTTTPPPAVSGPPTQSEATLDPQLLEELSRSDDIKVE